MNVEDFCYDLPNDLIAAHPAPRREDSRLMVVHGEDDSPPLHLTFARITELLHPGDLLVMNDSRVLPARLPGKRQSGGAVEILLLHPESTAEGEAPLWQALVRPGRKLQEGEVVLLGNDGSLHAEIGARLGEGVRLVRFRCDPREFRPLLERHGQVPLPPYILKRRAEAGEELTYTEEDHDRYQTVYARQEGSVAAPTAGLHFSRELLAQIEAMGVETARVTLHVGAGTFQTMEPGGKVENHRMHFEEYEVPVETAARVNQARREGRRVIAVGTTSVRTLESAVDGSGILLAGSGSTNLMITPGHRFAVIDALVTNFHLPRSTLLLLVSALVGRDRLLAAYEEAIAHRYRFFSYGDAMFLTARPDARRVQ